MAANKKTEELMSGYDGGENVDYVIHLGAANSQVPTEALTSTSATGYSHRYQRKTKRIEPVNNPDLVLKTPIAYEGNIDPSLIPIQKDGMAICERCGAIGVKDTFYTKYRKFCSTSCARFNPYPSVLSSNVAEENQHQNTVSTSIDQLDNASNETEFQEQSNVELTVPDFQIKFLDHPFLFTDDSNLIQFNGSDTIMPNVTVSSTTPPLALNSIASGNGANDNIDLSTTVVTEPPIKDMAQIFKFEQLPPSYSQMENIISSRQHRQFYPTHSYDWTPRLTQKNFLAAPVTCFPHAPGYDLWSDIGIGMKAEVENTDCDTTEIVAPGETPQSFWVATILNICGYNALMRYEGMDDSSQDFWLNLGNTELHAIGWCATRGKPLIPPRAIMNKYEDLKGFLMERLNGARSLPSSFYKKFNKSKQSRFRLGLILEAVDKSLISQVRLCTITEMVGKRLYALYCDSDEGFWCHEDSPIIHPVGWATTVGHHLAAPQDYLDRMKTGRGGMTEAHEDDATIELFKMNFSFEEYDIEGNGDSFLEGMKLEAVDPLNPSSICAATVMSVLKLGYLMIRMDSNPPIAFGSNWFCFHANSPSIFPVGFCAFNKIPLTPPHGYNIFTFNWESYLHETGTVAAGQHLFHRVVPEHGFEVGMSLECADLMEPHLVCVATVARVVGRLLKIHFDGCTDEYDQWLDCESPDIYPVGWCASVNYKLRGSPQSTSKVNTKTPIKRQLKIENQVTQMQLNHHNYMKN